MSLSEQAQTINTGIDSVKENLRIALQGKNVTVPTSAKLKDYSNYVEQIQVGIDTSNATAVSADIRSGKTAYVKGSLITGSMQNASLYQDGYLTVACNGGYVDGYQYLTLTDSNLIADNIKKDVTIFGVTGIYDGAGSAKVYAYTITGQGTTSAEPYINGDYYEVTGDDIPQALQALVTPTQYPVYTNGLGIFLFVYDSYGTGANYNIGYVYGTQSSQVQYLYINNASTITPVGSSYSILSGYGWSGTVTEYNNGGSNGGGGTSNADYIVSDASNASVNGDYVENGTHNGRPKYTNGACDMVWIQSGYDGYWAIGAVGYDGVAAPYCSCFQDTPTPPTTGWNGCTVTEGGSSGGGSTSNADYIVSGAVSVPEANGEYVEDGTYNNKPQYINTANNNAVIKCDSMLGWAVFYMGQPKYSTMDRDSSTPPVSATWTYGGTENVTVTKV
jgi:hypothetical protein